MSFDAELGPINYVVLTFDSAPMPTDGLDKLLELVDAGRILVLDAAFVVRSADGTVSTVGAAEVGAGALEGASSELVDDDDMTLVADAVPPGGVGIVVVYEDLTMLPVLEAWAAEGATVVSAGPILVDDLVETITATED